jgi:hypothetical protein
MPAACPARLQEIQDFHPKITWTGRWPAASAPDRLAAACQAVEDAGLPGKMPDPERTAVSMALGGIDVIQDSLVFTGERVRTGQPLLCLPAS